MSIARRIIKTGNSLSLTIPSKIIDIFNLKEGDVALIKVNRTKTSLTYIFKGHPQQLSLIKKS
jgi:antitoxin component of MazEF toxin-antitoxin module